MIQVLFLLYVIFVFEIIGRKTLLFLFNKHTKFNGVFGFLIYISIFQLVSTLPMYFQSSFSTFCLLIVPLSLLVSLIIVIKYGKEEMLLITAKLKEKDHFYIFTIISIIIITIVACLFTIPLGDSWLYYPMTVSSIENNIIYSHNGLEFMGVIEGFHGTNSIYLFSSILALCDPENIVYFLTTTLNILWMYLIVATFAIIVDLIFKKKKVFIIVIMTISILIFSSLFTIYSWTPSMIYNFGFTPKNGTNFMESIILFLFLFYLIFRNKDSNYKNIIFLSILVISSFAFTSSALYMVPIALFTFMVFDFFYLKSKLYIMEYFYASIFWVLYMIIYIFLPKSIIISFTLFFIYLIFIIILRKIISKISFRIIRNLITFFCGTYLLFFTSLFLIYGLNNKYNFLSMSTAYVEKTALYPTKDLPIIFWVLFIIGVIYIFKNCKIFFVYAVILFIFFVNPIALNTLGKVVSVNVYHRVYTMILPSIFFAAAFIQISDWIKIKNLRYLVPIFILFMTQYHWDSESGKFINNQGTYKVLYDKKVQSDEFVPYVENLSEYNFIPYSEVNIQYAGPLRTTSYSLLPLFQTNLNYVTTCSQECYYIIPKDQDVDLSNVVYEDKYIYLTYE